MTILFDKYPSYSASRQKILLATFQKFEQPHKHGVILTSATEMLA